MKSTPSGAARFPPGLYSFDVEVLMCLVQLLQRSASNSEHRSSRLPLAVHCATVSFWRRVVERACRDCQQEDATSSARCAACVKRSLFTPDIANK